MKPLVSVIIPCYRQARCLPDAIASALGQTYRRVEVVVVNDGSDDDTETVVRRYGDRIRYLRQGNKGLSAARNAGLAAASGNFIQFLDADDIIMPRKIERQVEELGRHPMAAVCISKYRKIEMQTGVVMRVPGVFLGPDPLKMLAVEWENGVSVPIHCGLFRRDAWGKGVSAPFEETLKSREDWVMWCILAARGTQFCYVDEELAEYRSYPESLCGNARQMTTSLIEAATMVRRLLAEAYLQEFDEYVLARLTTRARRDLFPRARDYYGLYNATQTVLDRLHQTNAWRLVQGYWRMRTRMDKLFRRGRSQ